MKKFEKFKTNVDELDLKNEQLLIRGKNLSEMINNYDFIDTVFHTLLNKEPSYIEKKLLNATLVSFHAGFEAYAPTIFGPRVATSVGTPISQALAVGYCMGGPFHAGAVERAMYKYRELMKSAKGDYEITRNIIKKKVGSHKKLFGFGHPLLKTDPRPEVLRNLATKLGYEHGYLKIYDAIRDELKETKNISPNVDGINGAILLSLGFDPKHGVGLFLTARTIGMLAHICEESTCEPWSAWGGIIGKGLVNEKLGKNEAL